jgi:transposase-like protein
MQKVKVYPYNTNLASEYYVLSMLYRKGFDAHLTLGNKKSVDIIIEKENGELLTIDVKGLAGKTCWPMDNFKKEQKNHFIVLVSFLNHIASHDFNPECWILPSKEARNLFYINPKGNRQVIDRHKIVREGQKYLNNWESIK